MRAGILRGGAAPPMPQAPASPAGGGSRRFCVDAPGIVTGG